MLEKLGFNAFICTDQSDFKSEIENNDINAIILDINMPTINGYDVAHIIKKELNLNIPIIAHTAAKEITVHDEKIIESKIDDVLLKPYSLKELEIKINKQLALLEKTAAL